ncbi:MAG: DUF488 family protein [Anaerolineales bacterium]
MVKILTIGAYGFTEEAFFRAIQAAGVQVFIDIRWRRGVRGTEYAFVNYRRLKNRLDSLGISYFHLRNLAPTPEIRQRQKDADKAERVLKRKRTVLTPDFVRVYQEKILSEFDPKKFLDELPDGTEVIAFFCVEREPAACHRSLVVERLRNLDQVVVNHLTP